MEEEPTATIKLTTDFLADWATRSVQLCAARAG